MMTMTIDGGIPLWTPVVPVSGVQARLCLSGELQGRPGRSRGAWGIDLEYKKISPDGILYYLPTAYKSSTYASKQFKTSPFLK